MYSTSATYAVGDYVLYEGGLYECNTAITTAEAWTAAHWTAKKLAPEVADLKTQVDFQANGTKVLTASDFVSGTWNGSTPVDNTARIRTEKIPVHPGERISINPGTICDYAEIVRFYDSFVYGVYSNTEQTLDITSEKFVSIIFKNGNDGVTEIDPSDYDAKVTIKAISSELFSVKEKTIVDLTRTYTGTANAYNFSLGKYVEPGELYTIEMWMTIPQTSANKTIYWRTSGSDLNKIGNMPVNTNYAKFSYKTPSQKAEIIKINSPITNCQYRIKITQEYVEYALDGITADLDDCKSDISDIQDDVADIKSDIEELENMEPETGIDVLPYRTILPSYYFGTVGNPESYEEADQYMDGIIKSVPDGKHVLFVTDVHWPNNTKHSNYMLQYTRGKLGVKDVLFGGDVLDRSADRFKAKQVLCNYFNQAISAFGDKLLSAWGNHDLNTANSQDLPTERMDVGVSAEIFTQNISKRAVFETTHNYGAMTGTVEEVLTAIVDDKITSNPEVLSTLGKTRDECIEALVSYNKLHYHVDDNAQKIRYIIYNTGCPDNNIVNTFLGVSDLPETYLQVNWLYNVLMTTPVGYDIIVCGHEAMYKESLNVNLVNSHYMRSFIGQLSAMKKKVSTTIWTDTDLTRIPSKWMPIDSQTLNFSNAPNVGKIILLSGHWHTDFTGKAYYTSTTSYVNKNYTAGIIANGATVDETNGEILLICTRCDRQPNDELKGTVNEQAFDIVTLTENGVVLTRMGYSASDVRERVFTLI